MSLNTRNSSLTLTAYQSIYFDAPALVFILVTILSMFPQTNFKATLIMQHTILVPARSCAPCTS